MAFPDLSALMASLQPSMDPGSNPGGFGPEPAAPPMPAQSQGGGFGATIQKIMPAILSAIALKQGGRQAAGAMLQGYSQQLAAARQRQEQAEQQALENARDEQESELRRQQLDQQRREKSAAFLQGVARDASQFTDEPTMARYMELATKIGRDVFGLEESEVRSVAGLNKTAIAEQAKQEAAETVARLQKTYSPEQFSDLVQRGTTISFKGKPTPIEDLLALANFPMETVGVEAALPLGMRGGISPVTVGQTQKPVLPQADPTEGITGSGEWASRVKARLRALRRTPTPEDVIRIQREVTAEDEARLAARKPEPKGQDPTTAAINALRLENMQAQKNTQGLPPRVQSQVTAQAAGFDRQPIVKRIQPMAEAVEFADSLSPTTVNPADDQALIYAFAKAMDPESVVREGEYATVQKYAQQWSATFGFNIARIGSNTPFLTPQARANMKRTIQDKYRAAKKQYDNVRGGFAARINKITGSQDGDSFLIDYAAGFPSLDAPPPPPAGGARSGGPGPVSVGGFQVVVKKPGGGQ